MRFSRPLGRAARILAPLLILAGAAVLAPAPVRAEDTDTEAWRREVARARILMKKGQHAEAVTALRAATADPEGARDPDAWTQLALASEEVLDIRAARDAFRKAVEVAAGGAADEAAAGLARIEGTYGEVRLSFPGWTPEGRQDLSFDGLLLDPRAKAYVARVQAAYQAGNVQAGAVLLPAGRYALAGFGFEVQAGTAPVDVAVVPPRRRPGGLMLEVAASGSAMVSLAGGGGLGPIAGGARVGIAPRLATLPSGAVRLAVRGTFEATGSTSAPDAYTGESVAGSAVRGGAEVALALDLRASRKVAVVPALGYGVSGFSGAWFAAQAVPDGSGQAEPGEVRLPTLAHGPALRIGVAIGGGTGPALLLEGGADLMFALPTGAEPGSPVGGADGLHYGALEIGGGPTTWLSAGIRAGLAFRR